MQSRAMRLTLSAAVWLALGGVALFLFQSERQIAGREARVATFEQRARDLIDTLARARAAQQAYVAEGQGVKFWIPEVARLVQASSADLDALYDAATHPSTGSFLDDARTQLTAFGDVDRRARDYLFSDQVLMAADVVFTEGVESTAAATKQVHAATSSERMAFANFETSYRRLQAMSIGGAGLLALLTLAVLGARRIQGEPDVAREGPPSILEAHQPAQTGMDSSMLDAATICTDFGRAASLEALSASLGKAAAALQATGLIVWMGDENGGDLRPALAHGYSSQALARMPIISRSDDNAVAAAYRTGRSQVVRPVREGAGAALICPLLTPTGCVGALTAEVGAGAENLNGHQALTTIFAAQLAAVIAPTPAAPASSDDAAGSRTATA